MIGIAFRTSFHHQPEVQHPKSSAIHKLPADYPIYLIATEQRNRWTSETCYEPTLL